MVRVTYEKEKLLKVIEMLRLEQSMDAEMMLSLIETEEKPEVYKERIPRKRGKREKKVKCDNLQYTQEERDMFIKIVSEYREPAFVPSNIVNGIATKLERTSGAIMTQLYEAKKTIDGKRRNEKIREYQKHSNSNVESSESVEANREEREQPDYKVQVHTVG